MDLHQFFDPLQWVSAVCRQRESEERSGADECCPSWDVVSAGVLQLLDKEVWLCGERAIGVEFWDRVVQLSAEPDTSGYRIDARPAVSSSEIAVDPRRQLVVRGCGDVIIDVVDSCGKRAIENCGVQHPVVERKGTDRDTVESSLDCEPSLTVSEPLDSRRKLFCSTGYIVSVRSDCGGPFMVRSVTWEPGNGGSEMGAVSLAVVKRVHGVCSLILVK